MGSEDEDVNCLPVDDIVSRSRKDVNDWMDDLFLLIFNPFSVVCLVLFFNLTHDYLLTWMDDT